MTGLRRVRRPLDRLEGSQIDDADNDEDHHDDDDHADDPDAAASGVHIDLPFSDARAVEPSRRERIALLSVGPRRDGALTMPVSRRAIRTS